MPPKTWNGFFLSALFFIFLGGCASTGGETPQATALNEPGTPPIEKAQKPLAIDPVPVEDEAPPPPPTLDDLIGLEPKNIQEILGPVSLRRWEGSAQVMHFTNGHCVLDIYFYEREPDNAFEATYIQARTLEGVDVEAGVCLTSLLPGGTWPEGFKEGVQWGQ